MKATKIGIWLDHHQAQLTEFTTDPMTTTWLRSDNDAGQNFHKGEWVEHNKEQHQQSDFYKKLGAVIQQYESVVLFGPTEAKTELLHTLRKDHLFDHIAITVENSDKMTEGQQHSFVRKHFSHH